MTEGSQVRGREVRQDIEAAILASCDVDEIVFGRTVKPRTSRFARVYMPEVSYQFGEDNTFTQTTQEYVVMIALTFPMSDAVGMTIPDAAEDAINPLIGELMKADYFGECLGFLHHIRNVQFDDDSEGPEPIFEVGLEFAFQLHVPTIRSE